ncbi:type II-A CRISPR-associated protein Csn2, partial [Bullifex sp.]|uniref:type II-A CRISPR-associated protein Csn2 n=1 Tax=Bullifex sp. TaxID=2815808 RepID=UPI002A80DC2E
MIILTSQLFSFEVKIKENRFNTLVIENKVLFRRIIKSINDQILGDDGDIIISKDYTPIELYGNVELILDPFNLNCNSKKTQLRISSELKRIIHNSSFESRINFIT